MTETTKTIEERVAALETKTTTLSTDVSNATTVANRAAGSATTANTTANTAKANAGAAQAAATTASAAAAAARKIAEDAALTAEDAFGETADNLKAIEEDVRPALKALQNKDAALQTAIDAVPDLTANVTALEMMFSKLQATVDAIPDASADITALTAKVTALETAVNAIPTVPAEILPLAVGESIKVSGVSENNYYLFRNIVPGTYNLSMTLDAFDKSEIGIPDEYNIKSYVEIEDVTDSGADSGNKTGLVFVGEVSNGSEAMQTISVDFDVFGGDKLHWPKMNADSLPQRAEGYIQANPVFTFHRLSYDRAPYTAAQKKLTWTLCLSRSK